MAEQRCLAFSRAGMLSLLLELLFVSTALRPSDAGGHTTPQEHSERARHTRRRRRPSRDGSWPPARALSHRRSTDARTHLLLTPALRCRRVPPSRHPQDLKREVALARGSPRAVPEG